MIIEEIDLESIKKGYVVNKETNSYMCTMCGELFEAGEIYGVEGKLYDARRAVDVHMKTKHTERFHELLYGENKYISLTSNQKELFSMIYAGLADRDIAAKLGISASTVRHQRFMFREKAKQAKMYLALYDLASESSKQGEEMISVHSTASMIDGRFIVTKTEQDKILDNAFSSLSPLTLSHFPAKEKKKVVILKKIAENFEKGKKYKEKEINDVLKGIYSDHVTIRRYLIEYGYMERTRDCSEYWIK